MGSGKGHNKRIKNTTLPLGKTAYAFNKNERKQLEGIFGKNNLSRGSMKYGIMGERRLAKMFSSQEGITLFNKYNNYIQDNGTIISIHINKEFKIKDADLSNLNLSKVYFYGGITFENCNVKNLDISLGIFSKLNFSNCKNLNKIILNTPNSRIFNPSSFYIRNNSDENYTRYTMNEFNIFLNPPKNTPHPRVINNQSLDNSEIKDKAILKKEIKDLLRQKEDLEKTIKEKTDDLKDILGIDNDDKIDINDDEFQF